MQYDEIKIGMKVMDVDGKRVGEVVSVEKIGCHKPIIVKWRKSEHYSGTQHVWPSELYEVLE